MDNSPSNPKIFKTKTNPKKDLNILRSNIYKYYNELEINSNYNTNYTPNINIKNINNNKRQERENSKKPEILKTITEDTSQYIEEMKKGSYNILVAVRCRPLSHKEREISLYETIQIMERKIIILKDPNGYLNPNNIRTKEQTLAFDYAFDQFEGQKDIFNCTTKFLIDGVTNGFNATVFAYGATGAGKTYTMLGTEENPGIMSLTLNELFEKIKSYPDREYTIKLWYLEIYNENIRDLLINNSENLDLREDPNKGVIVNGITEMIPKSSEHILNILKKGNKNRTTESTNANETSSRSHAILQIMVSYKNKTSGINYEIKYGKLNLIDLAGSERASMTKNKGMRLFEGANINKSLLTLGNCINALCEANEKGVKTYIPYRDSKLTRLLKDSLGGNARTVMIANISPFINSFDDTYNTLKYADRAKHIKTNIKRNVLNAQYHITNYINIIKNLQNRIFELESQIGINRKRDFTTSPIKKTKKEINENEILNNVNIKKYTNMNYLKNNSDLFTYNETNKTNSEEKDYMKETYNKYNDIIKKYVHNINKEIKLKEKIIDFQQEIFSIKNIDSNSKSKTKLKKLKNQLKDNIDSYKEISNKNEKEYNTLITNGSIDDINKIHLKLIYENRRINSENIDMKFKIFKMKLYFVNTKKYINDLEEQIIIRDIIIKKNNELNEINDEKYFLKVLNDEQILKYKNINQIQKKNFDMDENINNKKIEYKTKFRKRNENLNLDIKESQLFSKANTIFSKYSTNSLVVNNSLSDSNEFLKLKKDNENENENNELYLPKLSYKISNTCNKDNNNDGIYNSSLKSMLNDIKAINSDISFKFNIIEQKANNIKNKNKNNNNYNTSQDDTINNKNNITYNDIPINNRMDKSKNLIQNLFNKENEKGVKHNSSNKEKNKLYPTSKKLKNIPSACNIKVVNKGNNSNKGSFIATPINTKNNKNETRTKSSITRTVKNLPKSAKSSSNLKSNRANKNENQMNKDTDIFNINENPEKQLKLEEIFNKAKEEVINKRKYKYQKDESEFINNLYPNSLNNEKIDNYLIDNKISLMPKKKDKNKQTSPFYRAFKIKSKIK